MASKSSTKVANLPEDCVAHVISLTTPRDACRFTTISTLFHSAADSELVWERFLSDHLPNIAQSDAETQQQLLDVHPNKQLFMRLAETPIIIDGGLKSFFVDKATGKKCFMIAATEMSIVRGRGDIRRWGDALRYWEWAPSPDSRFAKVAKLIQVGWLELSFRVEASLFSQNTAYTSYLVFNLESDSNGFEHTPIETSVGLSTSEKSTKIIFLAPLHGEFMDPQIIRHGYHVSFPEISKTFLHHGYLNFAGRAPSEVSSSHNERKGRYPKRRADGWMESEVGECFVVGEGHGDEVVEVCVNEIKGGHWKRGLVIQGIEFRPKA